MMILMSSIIYESIRWGARRGVAAGAGGRGSDERVLFPLKI